MKLHKRVMLLLPKNPPIFIEKLELSGQIFEEFYAAMSQMATLNEAPPPKGYLSNTVGGGHKKNI